MDLYIVEMFTAKALEVEINSNIIHKQSCYSEIKLVSYIEVIEPEIALGIKKKINRIDM